MHIEHIIKYLSSSSGPRFDLGASLLSKARISLKNCQWMVMKGFRIFGHPLITNLNKLIFICTNIFNLFYMKSRLCHGLHFTWAMASWMTLGLCASSILVLNLTWAMASMDDSRALVPLVCSSSTAFTVFSRLVTLVTMIYNNDIIITFVKS